MSSFGNIIKEELLGLQIKAQCCKNSFITGTEVYAKSRKNELTNAVEAYKEKLLKSKHKKTFFDDETGVGFTVGELDGKKIPLESKRCCPMCRAHLVRGAFLVCGRASVSDSDIHIEMAVPSVEAADVLTEGLAQLDITPKRTVRRGELLLYYKKRSAASDFVAYIGAVSMSFNMMQDYILNQRRVNAVRQTNCDTKNISRSIGAAKIQADAVAAIIKHGDFDELPLQLRETAMLRYQNPSETLEALTELHEGKISRSGVNHRLSKIIEFALQKGYITKKTAIK